MECLINFEGWDWPICRAEPHGFEYIEVNISCPSSPGKVKAVILTAKARELGERLINLANILEKGQQK